MSFSQTPMSLIIAWSGSIHVCGILEMKKFTSVSNHMLSFISDCPTNGGGVSGCSVFIKHLVGRADDRNPHIVMQARVICGVRKLTPGTPHRKRMEDLPLRQVKGLISCRMTTIVRVVPTCLTTYSHSLAKKAGRERNLRCTLS